jgi:hypothetical protein
MEARATQQPVKARRHIDQNQTASYPARTIMDTYDHSESSGVMHLGVGQVDQQVTDSAIQDVSQSQPDLGNTVDIQPAVHDDLLPHGDLCH